MPYPVLAYCTNEADEVLQISGWIAHDELNADGARNLSAHRTIVHTSLRCEYEARSQCKAWRR